jgi:hypothetical protein
MMCRADLAAVFDEMQMQGEAFAGSNQRLQEGLGLLGRCLPVQ